MDRSKIFKKYEPHPENLLHILHDLQNESGKNFIADEDIVEVSRYLNLPANKVEATLSFYTMFSRRKRGKHIIRLCESPSCYMAGGEDLLSHLEQKLKVKKGETTKDGNFTLEASACLGVCDLAPAMMVDNDVHGNLTVEKVDEIINAIGRKK
ncbi:MAG: NADH-quinone oxidoreductase subunit NuoE [Candidatus Wallbacteria bacterium]|nr:NADH-quinone oxidoreductase subunit NuoE [Candidatus Wallbacteria bacterium]